MKRIFLALTCALSLSACAFTDASLPLNGNDITVKQGLVYEASQRSFNITEAKDSRNDVNIGYKRNGFGAKTADVTSEVPVEAVVSNAFSRMLQKNGHNVGSGSDINVVLDVTKFDFDNQMNFASVETIANLETNVRLLDAKNNQELLNKTYQGSYNRESMASYLEAWTEALNFALEDMMNKISMSPEFKQAIAK